MSSKREWKSANQTASRRAASPWLGPAVHWILVSLPVLTIAVIALAVFVVGAPGSYEAVRVWGGPTQGVRRFSIRLQAFERYRDLERGLPLEPLGVELSSGGRLLSRSKCTTDDAGFCEASFALGRPIDAAVEFAVDASGRRLAAGGVGLSVRDWLANARRRGGWVQSSAPLPLTIRLHPERGVLAVPFRDPIVIEVLASGEPVEGARLMLEPEGLVLSGSNERFTDGDGRVTIEAAPREHVVSLGIKASRGELAGRLYATLPVVPGALHARVERGRLLIEAPVPRPAAFYSVVNEHARLFGGRLPLSSDFLGGARASVRLPDDLPAPLWAVVASEPDLNTQAAVGWPLNVHGPATTLDVPDHLLLDGSIAAYEKSLVRPRRARWLAGVFALLALALALVLFVGRVHAADRDIERHFSEQLEGEAARFKLKQSALLLAVAVLCIALGFVLVGLISLMRVG